MNKPIHITEMRKQLDIAAIRKQLVNLVYLSTRQLFYSSIFV